MMKRSKISMGSGQYKEIKWKSVRFDEPIEANGMMISGYHIMNYRISESDIKRAVIKNKWNNGAFYDWKIAEESFSDVSKDDYVDYDPASGNFHKKSPDKCQIVLVKEGTSPEGPGGMKVEKSELIEYLKKNQMYFPNIDDYDAEMTPDEIEREVKKYLKIGDEDGTEN